MRGTFQSPLLVCLFISRITGKLLAWFSWSLVEGCSMGPLHFGADPDHRADTWIISGFRRMHRFQFRVGSSPRLKTAAVIFWLFHGCFVQKHKETYPHLCTTLWEGATLSDCVNFDEAHVKQTLCTSMTPIEQRRETEIDNLVATFLAYTPTSHPALCYWLATTQRLTVRNVPNTAK